MLNSFEQKFIVELSDITPNFGLKPTAILRYYQETFARYCAKYGVAGYDVYQMGLKWVFGQNIINFFNVIPIWNEEVITKVYISNVKKLRIYLDFEIYTQRGPVAKGQTTAYILDLNTLRPQTVENIVNKFDLADENFNKEIIKADFTPINNLISQKDYTISFSDIDYNNHTNNISYISLAFEGMPQEYIKEKFPKTIEIRYLQETFLNDKLICEINQSNDYFTYKITNYKDNSDVCLINAYWSNKNMNPNDFYEILNEARSVLNKTC